MKVSFESKGNFNKTLNWLNQIRSSKPTTTLSQIAKDGERALSANTPKETGETASGWVSEITSKGDIHEIAWKNTAHPESTANVAKLIEVGHGTGTGGYIPPQPYIKQAMEPVWKEAGDKLAKEMIK